MVAHPQRVLPIASLTKLMTALLVVENTKPGDIVTIAREVPKVQGSRMGYLKAGRSVRVETLLHGLLMSSGNDAAVALADHVAGSQARFVAMMNQRARDWALPCTHYVDPVRPGDPQPLVRGGPRPARRARARAAADRADRPPAQREGADREGSAGGGWRRRTRCCAPATRGRSA